MKLSQFKFKLPENLIAQYPGERRDECRLMVVHRKTGEIEHRVFKEILDYFGDGDTAELGERLVGQKAERAALQEALATASIGDYFHNLNMETFLDILTQ